MGDLDHRSRMSGCWHWHGGPYAVRQVTSEKDQTIVSTSQGRAGGSLLLGTVDHDDDTLHITALNADGGFNDRMASSLLVLSGGGNDGKILAAGAADDTDSLVRFRRSTGVASVSAFGSEVTVTASGTAAFTNLWQRSSDRRVYCLFRENGGNSWEYTHSDNDGDTWTTPATLVNKEVADAGVVVRPTKVDSGGRVDLAITRDTGTNRGTSNPSSFSHEDLHHAYWDTGNNTLHASDGTSLGAPPITPTDATLVFESDNPAIDPDGNGWTNVAAWDVVKDGSQVTIVTALLNGEDDHDYGYHHFDGSSWVSRVITSAGGGELYGAQDAYSPGISLDYLDPSRVYLCRGGAYQDGLFRGQRLERWVTEDQGSTWNGPDVLLAGLADQTYARPVVPLNAGQGPHPLYPVLLWGGFYQTDAQVQAAVLRGGRIDPAAKTADAVTLAGTDDFYTRTQPLVDDVDGKEWTVSIWFKRGTTGSGQQLRDTSNNREFIQFNNSDQVVISARNAANSEILSLTTSRLFDTTDWHHLLFSVNLATGTALVYVDDVLDMDVGILTDDDIDFTNGANTVGAAVGGGSAFNGCIAEVWIARTFVDIADESNRRKFVTRNLKAVNLGEDGALPLAAAPILYLSNPPTTFNNNRGSGGDFATNGNPTDCAGPPRVVDLPDYGGDAASAATTPPATMVVASAAAAVLASALGR